MTRPSGYFSFPPLKPRVLLPEGNKAAQKSALVHHHSVRTSRKLMLSVSARLAALGVLEHLRLPGTDGSVFEYNHIKPVLRAIEEGSLLNQVQLKLGERSLVSAHFLGTPGPERKISTLFMHTDGKPVALVKMGSTKVASTLILHEADVLKELPGYGFGFQMPRLLGHGEHEGVTWLAQSIVGSGGAMVTDWKPVHQKTVEQLVTKTGSRDRIIHTRFYELLKQAKGASELTQLEHLLPGVAMHARLNTNEREPWPMALAHGDFVSWNIRLMKDGQLAIYDWEYCQPDMPLGWDVVRYFWMREHLLRRKSANKAWAYLFSKEVDDALNGLERVADRKIPDRHFLIASVVFDSVTGAVHRTTDGHAGSGRP